MSEGAKPGIRTARSSDCSREGQAALRLWGPAPFLSSPFVCLPRWRHCLFVKSLMRFLFPAQRDLIMVILYSLAFLYPPSLAGNRGSRLWHQA